MDRLRTLSPSPTPSLAHSHSRSLSRSLSRSRPRITDDLLSDLSPTTTFEAFTSSAPSRLKTSIEAATQSERAFGIQASFASKKIKEWMLELSSWPWPAGRGSSGFETPEKKKKKLFLKGQEDSHTESDDDKYIGCLLASQVIEYELRLEEIATDMEDLKVDELKREVLANTAHFASSRLSGNFQQDDIIEQERQHFISSGHYTAMDDFTAIITATVLRALPNLSRLTRLMDVWSVRLTVLRRIPPLLDSLNDAELALASAWKTIERATQRSLQEDRTDFVSFNRQSFSTLRYILQDKVTTLGQTLDFMLDTLEGWEDTLPDEWLDRMEKIENDYGEWAVAADRTIREDEWRKERQIEERHRQEEEARKEEERIVEEIRKTEARKEEEARRAEEARQLEESHRAEEARIAEEVRLAEEARKLEQMVERARAAEARAVEAAKKLEEVENIKPGRLAESSQLQVLSGAGIESNLIGSIETKMPFDSNSTDVSLEVQMPGANTISEGLLAQSREQMAQTLRSLSEDTSLGQGNERIVIHSPDDEPLSFLVNQPTEVDNVDYADLTAPDLSELRRLSTASSHSNSSSIPQIVEEKSWDQVSTPGRNPQATHENGSPRTPAIYPPVMGDPSHSIQSPGGQESSLPPVDEEIEYSEFRATHLGGFNFGASTPYNERIHSPRQSSVSPRSLMTPAQIYEMSPKLPHRSSVSSNASTVIISRPANIKVARRLTDSLQSPMSDKAKEQSSPVTGQQSPLASRFGSRPLITQDYTPPGSPKVPAIHPRTHLHVSQENSRSESPESPNTSESSFELPLLPNVDVSDMLDLPSPTRASDDQMQQQISEILQSLPARIRLTSEPDTNHDTTHPKKTRSALIPRPRSHSSMSTARSYSSMSNTRSSTPSFTLRPAYSRDSRPRAQSGGVSETRLYHLSRTAGETPIKLFVRLVGENGERVMVRVGGGWADFGEYLKEYAAHHRRRSLTADDKVEIQDIPPRHVSSSSMMSTSTVRNGRASPVSRPTSALERPSSSLAIRKTRRSEADSTRDANTRDTRVPSTPMPFNSRREKSFATPPSAVSTASSSKLSWSEEDSSLGLAGPKSKKVDISPRDKEWVESMKDKVRKASAEKEKRSASDFGVIGKVGGTKRLFKRG